MSVLGRKIVYCVSIGPRFSAFWRILAVLICCAAWKKSCIRPWARDFHVFFFKLIVAGRSEYRGARLSQIFRRTFTTVLRILFLYSTYLAFLSATHRSPSSPRCSSAHRPPESAAWAHPCRGGRNSQVLRRDSFSREMFYFTNISEPFSCSTTAESEISLWLPTSALKIRKEWAKTYKGR